MQTKVPAIESALPVLALALFEALKVKKRSVDRFWLKPWFWNLTMLVIVGLVILRHICPS